MKWIVHSASLGYYSDGKFYFTMALKLMELIPPGKIT